MAALTRILNKNPEMADDYVQKAIECIKAEQTVIRSIQLLKDIDFAGGVAKKYDLKGMNLAANIFEEHDKGLRRVPFQSPQSLAIQTD